MQLRFDIIPLVGIGPVRLGASRMEVRAAMGSTPVSFQKNMLADDPLADAWFGNSFQVFYQRSTDTAEFIEVCRGGPVAVMFQGYDLLATPASDLIPALDIFTPFDRAITDPGFSFIFQEWQISLWRLARPEDDEEDARFFANAGAAVSGYFRRSAETPLLPMETGE